MAGLLIIGAGGVGRVAALKCVESGAFTRITLGSRRLSKCEEIANAQPGAVEPVALDASDEAVIRDAIAKSGADIVLNVALPYQDMPIMRACVQAGAHYVDTAVPETPDRLYTDTDDADWYGPQWALGSDFQAAGLTALLGAGSDPGMVNAFCAHVADDLLDSIETIDIMDVNAGDHGYPFATNFNPEINLREVQAPAHYLEDGEWREVPALSVGAVYDFPEVDSQPIFLMDHDELHSLCRRFPDARHIKFWMGFGDKYREHFHVLRGLGLLSHEPVEFRHDDGRVTEVVPLKLLRQLLPDPASLASRYTGKTCIGCLVSGRKADREETYFIYNICSHEQAFSEVGSQAISYTAGVCAATGAAVVARGDWQRPGVFNVEDLPSQPFLDLLAELGMPWHVQRASTRLLPEVAR